MTISLFLALFRVCPWPTQAALPAYMLFMRCCSPLDILLSGLEEVPNLQNSVSELLEKWWCQEREGKEGVVPHCLLYVIARTLNEKAKVSNKKKGKKENLCVYVVTVRVCVMGGPLKPICP